MNGLLTQASPSRIPKNRGGAGGVGVGAGAGDVTKASRAAVGRSRGRRRGGSGSRLPFGTPSFPDRPPSGFTDLANGETSADDSESADESEISHPDHFNKVGPGNQYEQVLVPFLQSNKTYVSIA